MNAEQLQVFSEVEKMHWWFAARRRILQELVYRVLPAGKHRRVVDIGCGTGGNIAELARDYDCLGVDASADAVRLATDLYPHARFRQAATPDDVADEVRAADLVLMMDVIEHVRDDFELVSQIVRLMRPGSHLVLTVPADPSLWSPHDEAVLHFRRYDTPRFAVVWEGLPVKARLLSPCNSRLYWTIKGMRWVASRRGRSLGQGQTDLHVSPAPINSLLRRIFAGETRRLTSALDSGRSAYRRGVSLVAVLSRQTGDCAVRTKPDDLSADPYAPPSWNEKPSKCLRRSDEPGRVASSSYSSRIPAPSVDVVEQSDVPAGRKSIALSPVPTATCQEQEPTHV